MERLQQLVILIVAVAVVFLRYFWQSYYVICTDTKLSVIGYLYNRIRLYVFHRAHILYAILVDVSQLRQYYYSHILDIIC